jgi:hypothetical protein
MATKSSTAGKIPVSAAVILGLSIAKIPLTEAAPENLNLEAAVSI